jgi:hypothetical protein
MDKLELFNAQKFVYFSMWIEAKKNKETNKIVKVPHFPKGYKEMTQSTIFNKSHSVIAIRTGIISNIFVIDIDDLTNQTAKKLNDICFGYCKWKVSTRKGFHYYFKYDERLNSYQKQSKASNINNALGFDTRGNGGIIFFGKYNLDSETYKYELLEEKPQLIEMNNEIFEYVKLLLAPEVSEDGEVEVNSKPKKVSIGIKYDGIINKINLEDMLKYIECINDKQFLSFETWRKILFMCYNCNNDKKVAEALHKRSQIGKYKSVSYEEVANKFYNNEYYNDFNIYGFINIAKEDNFNGKYDEYFGDYDEYDFEYKIMDETFYDKDNKNKLGYEAISSYFKDEKLCVLKSPYGSGKTTYIKKLIAEKYNDKRIIFLVMRQSLSYDLENEMSKLGFKNYLNKEKLDYKDDKIIISLDSLRKIQYYKLNKCFIKTYDLVICDEFCSLLSHFDFNQIQGVEELYKLFELIINKSTQTYFLDGDISNREIKYLQNYLNYESKPLFNNKVATKFNMNLTYDGEKYFKLIDEDLKNGKKVCIPSMSAGFCETIKEKYKKYKVLIYNQKTDDDIKKQLVKIEELIKQYDIFVYSPSITVGVNIDFEYFQSIYGYICNSVCARVYYQMLFRVRNIVNKNINILVDKLITLNTNKYEQFQEVKQTIYDNDYTLNAFEYIKCWNKWESNNNKNFLNVFKYYTTLKGFTFNIEKKPEGKIETQTNSIDNIKKILESELINYDTFCKLSEKVKKLEATTDDKYKIEKYMYFSKFKLDKDFKDEKVFKDEYYKKLHLLKGYLYNKFHNEKYKLDNETILNNICKNIKDDNINEKAKESNIKYKNFYEINKNVETLDEKYYNNKFDKKIIENKHKIFLQLEDIMKEKDGKIDKELLTTKKDDLVNIFNSKEFKIIFEQRTIKEATPKKLLGSLNSVYNMFGMEIENIYETQNNKDGKRKGHLEVKKMDCIPKCYTDYEQYINKYRNNDIDYMKYFIKLVKEKKQKKKNNFTIEDFIIDFS